MTNKTGADPPDPKASTSTIQTRAQKAVGPDSHSEPAPKVGIKKTRKTDRPDPIEPADENEGGESSATKPVEESLDQDHSSEDEDVAPSSDKNSSSEASSGAHKRRRSDYEETSLSDIESADLEDEEFLEQLKTQTRLLKELEEARSNMRLAATNVNANPGNPMFCAVLESEMNNLNRIEQLAIDRGLIEKPKPMTSASVTLAQNTPKTNKPFDLKGMPVWSPDWKGTKAEVRAFIGRMKDARNKIQRENVHNVDIDLMRDLWVHAVSKMGGDSAELSDDFRGAKSWEDLEEFLSKWFLRMLFHSMSYSG
jgi:hypothetical protein